MIIAGCIRQDPADHSGASDTATSGADSGGTDTSTENWCGCGITPVAGSLTYDDDRPAWTCSSAESIEERCVDVFGGYTGGECLRLRSILEATGWLAGSTTNMIARGSLLLCTEPDGQPVYRLQWLDQPELSNTIYEYSAMFDASGIMVWSEAMAIPLPLGYYFGDGFCCEDQYVNYVWWGGERPDLTCDNSDFLAPADFAGDTGLPGG